MRAVPPHEFAMSLMPLGTLLGHLKGVGLMGGWLGRAFRLL